MRTYRAIRTFLRLFFGLPCGFWVEPGHDHSECAGLRRTDKASGQAARPENCCERRLRPVMSRNVLCMANSIDFDPPSA